MARKKDIKNHSGKKSGGRNTTTKNICVVLERLEDLDFVNHVSPGKFKDNNSDQRIDIVGYDYKKRQYVLNVYGGKCVQKVILNVHQQKPIYENAIRNCID